MKVCSPFFCLSKNIAKSEHQSAKIFLRDVVLCRDIDVSEKLGSNLGSNDKVRFASVVKNAGIHIIGRYSSAQTGIER